MRAWTAPTRSNSVLRAEGGSEDELPPSRGWRRRGRAPPARGRLWRDRASSCARTWRSCDAGVEVGNLVGAEAAEVELPLARARTARLSSLLRADGNGKVELPPARGRRRRGRASPCAWTATGDRFPPVWRTARSCSFKHRNGDGRRSTARYCVWTASGDGRRTTTSALDQRADLLLM